MNRRSTIEIFILLVAALIITGFSFQPFQTSHSLLAKLSYVSYEACELPDAEYSEEYIWQTPKFLSPWLRGIDIVVRQRSYHKEALPSEREVLDTRLGLLGVFFDDRRGGSEIAEIYLSQVPESIPEELRYYAVLEIYYKTYMRRSYGGEEYIRAARLIDDLVRSIQVSNGKDIDRHFRFSPSEFGRLGTVVTKKKGTPPSDDIAQGIMGIRAFWDDTTESVRIESVIPGLPADQAGLVPGDFIVGIGGKLLRGCTKEQVLEANQGLAGTTLSLIILSVDEEETRVVSLTLALAEKYDRASNIQTFPSMEAQITTEGIVHSVLLDTTSSIVHLSLAEQGEINIDEEGFVLRDRNGDVVRDILYLRFWKFEELHKLHFVLDELSRKEAKGIIIDLRWNPGGIMQETQATLYPFLPKQTVVAHTIKSNGVSTPSFTVAPGNVYTLLMDVDFDYAVFREIPLVVLANRHSYSASEMFIGALQDYGRATFIGEPTGGKGSVTGVQGIMGVGVVEFTTDAWSTPKGRSASNGGIAPDIYVDDQPEFRIPELPTFYPDETLWTAIDFLDNKSNPFDNE